jgi:hypothetical protein
MEHRPDVGRIKERARALSKSLFGTQFRAEVGAYIAVGEEPFWARAIATQLEIPENKVSAELSRFAANNLLSTISVARWDRRRLYTPTPGSNSYWTVALDIVQRAAEEEALRIGMDREAVIETYLRAIHGDDAPTRHGR